MKLRINQFLILSTLTMVGISHSQLHAATNPWVGDTDNSFLNGANWTSDPALPDFGADIMRFDGPGTQANATITNVNLTMTNTGTVPGTSLAQILFSGTTPAMTLSGGTITLGTAATNLYNNAIVLSSGSTVTQTVASNLVVGDGASYTASIVNTNTSVSGGLLKIAGNITGGSGAATPGVISFSFGNTSTQNGDYEVSGNMTAGGATSMNLTKRGSGILTLIGSNAVGNGASAGLAQNEAGSKIRINGGTSTLNNGVDAHWGGNNINAAASAAPIMQISAGTLNAQSARNLRSSLLIDGGTLNIGSPGGVSRLSFDATGGVTSAKTFSMTSGQLNLLADSSGSSNQGVRFGNDNSANNNGTSYAFTGTQSGGSFVVYGRGASNQTFSLGTALPAAYANNYTLSGGTLDIRGSVTSSVPDNNAYLLLGSDAPVIPNPSLGSTTFTLSGTGKLVVRSSGTQGIVGSQVGATQVFSLQGGTLVAGRIDAANLRGSAGGANGTIVNNGSTISPGDAGFAGRCLIVNGGLNINSGKLAIDLGGATANTTTWQDPASSAKYDRLTAGGDIVLGGSLEVALIDGFVPANSDNFSVVVASTGFSVSGTFTNLAAGRVNLTGGASFAVNISATSVVLSDYQAAAGTTYASWISGFSVGGQAAANDDFDNDNLDNVVENVLGANPSVYSNGLTQVSATAGSFKFRHDQSNTIATDVTKSYQWSTDLVNWAGSGASLGGTTATISASAITDVAAPANDVIEVTVTVTSGPATKVFGRLVATKAP
jgi:hypothetical protein